MKNTAAINKRLDIILPILRRHGYSCRSDLYYSSLRMLDRIIKYLEETPRITAIGRELTEEQAARIIGITLTTRGNLGVAMRLDINDNSHGKIRTTLKKTGALGVDALVEVPKDTDQDLMFSAVLYAENIVFERFHYHPHAKSPKLQELYDYVAKNPSLAYRIMEIAKARNSLDTELIDQTIRLEHSALESGVL